MATSVLTSRLIEASRTKATPNGLYLWDSELKGFGVRISPTCVTWLAQKSLGKGKGSTQRIVVGHYPALSLKEARVKAGQTISALAACEDVRSTRAAAKQAKREQLVSPTLREASDDYLKEWSRKTRRSSSGSYEKSVRRLFDKIILPELGASKRVNEVAKVDIRLLLKTRKDAGQYEAARSLFAQLRPFFDWCVHQDYLAISPCVGVTPPDAGKERQHKLTDQEIKALWSASHECNSLGPMYRVLLLTAQRRGEVAGMRWQELNLDKAEWLIPASRTKNGREHLVHLSAPVLDILRSLPQRRPSEYVFGKYPDAPASGFSKATRELHAAMLVKLREDDAQAQVSDWRIHDLRRTAASGMASLGIAPHVVEAVLNHTPAKLQRTYQVYLYANEKETALEAWANHVLELLELQKCYKNVVYLRS